MNVSIVDEFPKKKSTFSKICKFFDRFSVHKKLEKGLLSSIPDSQIGGFQRILLIFYLYYAENLLIILIFASILDQIAVISLSDEMVINLVKHPTISIIFTLECIVDILFTVDFLIKMILRSYFMDSGNYGIGFMFLDALSGPLVFLFDLSYLIILHKFAFLGFLFRTSKVLTFEFSRKVLHKLKVICLKVSPLIWSLFVFFYLFSYFAEALYSDELPAYFTGLPATLFTMFQFMTVDSWGMLGRLVLEEQGVFSAYYMAIFIFIMTYFFLNVLLAFVVDNMTPSNAPILFQKIEENDEEHQSLGEILGRGKIHDWMVNIIFVISLLQVHNYTKFNDGRGNLAIVFEITIDFIFTLSFLSRAFNELSRKDKFHWKFILSTKFFSGPVALILNCVFYFCTNTAILPGHYFRIFQIMTTKTLSSFIYRYFPIFPKIAYPFLLLMGIITFLACWTTERLGAALPEFFNNFNLSIYSFIQMLSLDEWCNTVTRGLLNNALESALIFIIFIFVANYILLNVMLAIACSEIKTMPLKEIPFKENITSHYIRHSFQKILSNLLILIEFNHKILFRIVENHHVILENPYLKKPSPKLEEISEIENFYNLKESLIKEKNEVIIEYKGKKVTLKKLAILEVNKNCEIIVEKEYREKLRNSTEFSSLNKSFFEIEIPSKLSKIKKQSLWEKIWNTWILIKRGLWTKREKSLDFQSF